MPVVLSRKGGGSGSAGVSSLEGLTGAVTLSEGPGVTFTQVGNDIEISSSGGWTNAFTETGASLVNWTQDSGTWSVVANAFHVDSTGGIARLRFTAAQPAALGTLYAYEADVMMEAASVGSDAPLGLLVGWLGTGAAAPTGQLFKAGAGAGTKQIRGELDATGPLLGAFTPNPTWAFDVYQNLKLVVMGSECTISLNDVPVAWFDWVGNVGFTANRSFVGIIANNAVVNVKNIRLDYSAP